MKRGLFDFLAKHGRMKPQPKLGAGISVLIPARCLDKDQRLRNLQWNRQYWKSQLPGAEVIVGEDWRTDLPFSKSAAVNNAVRHSTGDILVIADADIYIDASAVLSCAEQIRAAKQRNQRMWFIPYRQFYRLTQEASELVLQSNPAHPHTFAVPPPSTVVLDSSSSGASDAAHGHWFGAGIQILPREAYKAVGGWDTRFRGWGGEDHSIMMATDTLYWPHKTLPGQVLHLWHPMLGPEGKAAILSWKHRMWKGQNNPGANDELTKRYYGANGRVDRMRKIVDEDLKER